MIWRLSSALHKEAVTDPATARYVNAMRHTAGGRLRPLPIRVEHLVTAQQARRLRADAHRSAG